MWNIPFNGLGVAACAGAKPWSETGSLPNRPGPVVTADLLLADPTWLGLVRELMEETRQVALALGLQIEAGYVEHEVERTKAMGAYRASTLIDFEQGRPLEIDSLFALPLAEARRLGVSTPRLSRLVEILTALATAGAPPAGAHLQTP
jgi:2-dehydropantoate 2-reductase